MKNVSSRTYNLSLITGKETAKFLNVLVLSTHLHLWKVSPEDHNLAYKTSTIKLIDLEEIRILQDVIVLRTGIGQCKQGEHVSCFLRTGREKKRWIRKALNRQAELRVHC